MIWMDFKSPWQQLEDSHILLALFCRILFLARLLILST